MFPPSMVVASGAVNLCSSARLTGTGFSGAGYSGGVALALDIFVPSVWKMGVHDAVGHTLCIACGCNFG